MSISASSLVQHANVGRIESAATPVTGRRACQRVGPPVRRGFDEHVVHRVVALMSANWCATSSCSGGDVKDRCGTLGIMLLCPHVGRGHGTDTVRVTAAYREAGFVEEGRQREAIHQDGRWYDHVHMAILDREWRSL